MFECRFHRTRLTEHVLRTEKQQVLRKNNETETGLVQPKCILIKEGHWGSERRRKFNGDMEKCCCCGGDVRFKVFDISEKK